MYQFVLLEAEKLSTGWMVPLDGRTSQLICYPLMDTWLASTFSLCACAAGGVGVPISSFFRMSQT